MTQPSKAVTRLIRRLPQYASMYGCWKRSRMFKNGAWLLLSSNAPTITDAAGTNRNAIVYAKNGRGATHASERRLRPDTRSGRRACGAASVEMPYPPTCVGQFFAIRAFAATCWPMLANFTLL